MISVNGAVASINRRLQFNGIMLGLRLTHCSSERVAYSIYSKACNELANEVSRLKLNSTHDNFSTFVGIFRSYYH